MNSVARGAGGGMLGGEDLQAMSPTDSEQRGTRGGRWDGGR